MLFSLLDFQEIDFVISLTINIFLSILIYSPIFIEAALHQYQKLQSFAVFYSKIYQSPPLPIYFYNFYKHIFPPLPLHYVLQVYHLSCYLQIAEISYRRSYHHIYFYFFFYSVIQLATLRQTNQRVYSA